MPGIAAGILSFIGVIAAIAKAIMWFFRGRMPPEQRKRAARGGTPPSRSEQAEDRLEEDAEDEGQGDETDYRRAGGRG